MSTILHQWTPSVGEQLETFCEAGNEHDKHAVAVTKENSSAVRAFTAEYLSNMLVFYQEQRGDNW